MNLTGFPCRLLWRIYTEGWLDGRELLRQEMK